MEKNTSIFLIAIIEVAFGIILYNQKIIAADFFSQYIFNVSDFHYSSEQDKIETLPVTIIADSAKGSYPDNVIFTGNVDIYQYGNHLLADEVQLHQKRTNNYTKPKLTIYALGNIRYHDNQVILKGMKAWSNLDTKDINIWKADYQILNYKGYGKADLIKLRSGNRYIFLKNASFTLCPPRSKAWYVVGNKVVYDQEEQTAKVWNAQFKIGSVPIFYSPYLQFPIGNKSCSGFLIPSIKYGNKNYFEFYLPYYWNIAPNLGITITPHYMHKRNNIMWENEFRYLTKFGDGLMDFYYLPSDKKLEIKHPAIGNSHRWMYHWQHSGVIDQVKRFNVNYTKVSDPYYFNDFSSKNSSSSDGYITQMLSTGYVTQKLNAIVSTQQFQTFSKQITNNYGTEPQLDINWRLKEIGPIDILIYGQVVRFVNSNPRMPKATRIHLEPSIDLLWSNDWANLDAEVKLMATRYKQKNLDNYNITNNTNLSKSAIRMLHQFKIDGKLFFERTNILNDCTQILEPRIQYLYIPYRDQRKINNYDSSLLQLNYNNIFRNCNYGGIDRFFSTNKITAGITSHVFDSNFAERFNISIGQIYYFNKSSTNNSSFIWKNNNKIGSLIWISDTYWRITDRWSIRGDMQYKSYLNNISTSSALLEYQCNKDRIVQLTYRYASPKYIHETLSLKHDTVEHYNREISQIGGIASWLITDRWSIIGAYYFDIDNHRATDQKLGFQYKSCCYAVRFGCERKFNGWNTHSNQGEYNNTLNFSIDLHGTSSKPIT